MRKKIVLFGATGMLGRETLSQMPESYDVVALGSADCDIADREQVGKTVAEHKPDIIINCAAYTAVDKAEDEAEKAWRINALGSKNLAEAVLEADALLIHVSTDYVFDGTGSEPYTEEMPCNPLGAYGKTKREGEEQIAATGCKHVIVRTQWLYSSIGKNFYLTMRRLFAERDVVKVVSDQRGTPTSARDLGAALIRIADTYGPGKDGVYHFSNGGTCTWYDFAVSIAMKVGATCEVLPIRTSDYPTRAVRPAYSVLSKDKIVRAFGVQVRHWREALATIE